MKSILMIIGLAFSLPGCYGTADQIEGECLDWDLNAAAEDDAEIDILLLEVEEIQGDIEAELKECDLDVEAEAAEADALRVENEALKATNEKLTDSNRQLTAGNENLRNWIDVKNTALHDLAWETSEVWIKAVEHQCDLQIVEVEPW